VKALEWLRIKFGKRVHRRHRHDLPDGRGGGISLAK
jgi:hypothetical protein